MNLTVVENDVWIGDGAVILKGVTVGTGSVIGANSVVTKDIPPYAIVGGVPAKTIRFRFENDLAEQMLKSEWWEFERSILESFPLLNVYQFIEAINSSDIQREIFKTYYFKPH